MLSMLAFLFCSFFRALTSICTAHYYFGDAGAAHFKDGFVRKLQARSCDNIVLLFYFQVAMS